jgi:hypothetical protein
MATVRAKTWSIALVLATMAALPGGCAAFRGVEPTNLTPVVVGASRDDVEQAVGESRDERSLACGVVAVYAFDRGVGRLKSNIQVASIHPLAPLIASLLSDPFIVEGQKGELDIVYGPDNRVIEYAPGRETDRDQLAETNGLAYEVMTPEALAQRYYDAGLAAPSGVAGWGCLCHAAHLGNAAAQLAMARSYRFGLPPVTADPVEALSWSLIAERHGDSGAATMSAELIAAMTPQQIADAHTRAKQWSPDTSACRRMMSTANTAPVPAS